MLTIASRKESPLGLGPQQKDFQKESPQAKQVRVVKKLSKFLSHS